MTQNGAVLEIPFSHQKYTKLFKFLEKLLML